jgi:hypothetical protein
MDCNPYLLRPKLQAPGIFREIRCRNSHTRVKDSMQFLRRNRFAILTVAVMGLGCVLVLQQQLTNLSHHSGQVEDFLLLQDRNETKAAEHIYQVLIQRLPHIGDRELVQDLQRTAMVIDVKNPPKENLVWKYYVSVGNELKRRADKRLEKALKQTATAAP